MIEDTDAIIASPREFQLPCRLYCYLEKVIKSSAAAVLCGKTSMPDFINFRQAGLYFGNALVLVTWLGWVGLH
jgi:hypothetical protein